MLLLRLEKSLSPVIYRRKHSLCWLWFADRTNLSWQKEICKCSELELIQWFSKSNPYRLLTDLPSSLQWRWPLLKKRPPLSTKEIEKKVCWNASRNKESSRFILVNPLTFISQFYQSIFCKVCGNSGVKQDILVLAKQHGNTECVHAWCVCVCICYSTRQCMNRYKKQNTRLQTVI